MQSGAARKSFQDSDNFQRCSLSSANCTHNDSDSAVYLHAKLLGNKSGGSVISEEDRCRIVLHQGKGRGLARIQRKSLGQSA